MPVTISSISGEIINDSRNVPTLSVTVHASDGSKGTFSVPSGASTGSHEAYELRDDTTGHGNVDKALSLLLNEIRPVLVGKDVTCQREVDELLCKLDGTENKSRLGGNTLIGVSVALCKAAAQSQNLPLWNYIHKTFFSERTPSFPRIYANLVNGGKHASTKLAFQEYHVVPKTTVMKDAFATISLIQEKLHEVSIARYGVVKVGDEGGFALPIHDVEEPLSLLEGVVTTLQVRDDVDFALDVAASSFFDNESNLYSIDGQHYDNYTMTSLYENLASTYSLLSVEDPYQEEDFNSFTQLKSHIGNTLRVGDDLTTTNKERLLRAIQEGSVDALIVKPNQIGTLTETVDTMKCAQENNIQCIVSHRSGETLDDFIADLAYGSGAFGIKIGARGPKEREAKYARLLAIENTL